MSSSSSSTSSSSSRHVDSPKSTGGGRKISGSSELELSLTPQQLSQLEELKAAVIKVHPSHTATDWTYLRFLRARKFVVADAIKMYLEYLQWRQEANVDDVLVNPPSEMRALLGRIMPESFHKFDKYGLPAYFMKAGKTNPELLCRYVTVEDMARTHIWGMEYSFARAAESSKKFGKNIDRFVNIVDLDGLSMSHRQCAKFIKHIAKIDNNYYPEALGKTYLVNAPWIFGTLWSIVKGWIDPNTREKIHVLGTDYQDVLRERFHLEDLPKEYGGKCDCAGGCVKVYSTEEVKEYLKAEEAKMELTSVKVEAGKSHQLDRTCGQFGAEFYIYFKTASGPIQFTATFTPQDKSKETRIWQKTLSYPGEEPVKMYYCTDFPGVAQFKFHNDNWYTREVVKYSIKQVEGVEGVKKELKMDDEHVEV